jgi:hypothetical protein
MPGAMTDGRRNLVAAAAIVGVAFLLSLPAILGPVRLNDSFWIDWVWLDQFASELGRGVLYPRWLPLSHHGLGSPVFYYYPPLAFYLGSGFALGGLGIYPALVATFFAGYLLAGAGMYLWLKDQAPRPLIGALIFMAAPYHTSDFYLRGAVAEFIAIAAIPFAMAGLNRIALERRDGFAIAAIGYAALLAGHLPLALLASVFLIGPYAAMKAYRDPKRLLPLATALATGIALAGIYLVPALLLDPYRDAAKLWSHPMLQPGNWTVWNLPYTNAFLAFLAIAVGLTLPLVTLIIGERSRWAAFGLLCVLLGIGILPILWELPLLRSVQFPFRIFPLAEFALATAAARARLGPVLMSLALFPVLFYTFVTAPPGSKGYSLSDFQRLHPDVPENLPPGPRPYSWPSKWALGVATSNPSPRSEGGSTVDPVFYFPAWHVTCAGRQVETFPESGTQLLSYRGQGCVRSLGWTSAEYAGAFLSILGLVTLAGGAMIGRRRPAPSPVPVL